MSRAGQKMQQTISLSISDYHRRRERDRKRREILEYDNKTHGAGGCRLGGADRKKTASHSPGADRDFWMP